MKKFETKHLVAIIISLILGASILGYGYLDYRYKKEALEQKIQSESDAEVKKFIEKVSEEQKAI